MASGNITLYIQSVDYNGGGPYTRGAEYSNLVARWNVDDSGWLTLAEERYETNETYWWICSSLPTSIDRYWVDWIVQFKPDGEANWQDLYSAKVAPLGPCPSYDYRTGTNVKAMMESFCGSFPGVRLTKSGMLRVLCGANLAPAPDAGYPHAFPNAVYSAESQVPVHIDVSWTATLNYDANGGSGAPSATTATATGESINVTVSNGVPTRTNYRFEGWNTNSSALEPTYHGGDQFTISKSNPTRTLYAIWRKYYRPGKIKTSSNWAIIDRDAGGDGQKTASNWQEMRTIDAPTGKNDPPKIYRNGDWYNQRGGTYPPSAMA